MSHVLALSLNRAVDSLDQMHHQLQCIEETLAHIATDRYALAQNARIGTNITDKMCSISYSDVIKQVVM